MNEETNLLPLERSIQPIVANQENLSSMAWPTMTVDRYAAFEQASGTRILHLGDIWWVRIRPFFYRPLLPYKTYDLNKVRSASKGRGIFQHAVLDGQQHNSFLNPIVFENLREYEHRKLRENVRRSLKKAMASGLTIRRMLDQQEFCEKGHPTYLSFYQRTGYRFGEGRRERGNFESWARTLFQFRDVVVLGVFFREELVAFELACLIERTLFVKTLVTSDVGLNVEASDFLLHSLRSSLVSQTTIEQISYGMLTRNPTLDRYKTMRGAKVLSLPSLMHVNPVVLWSIRKLNRNVYTRLRGVPPVEGSISGFLRESPGGPARPVSGFC